MALTFILAIIALVLAVGALIFPNAYLTPIAVILLAVALLVGSR